MKIIVFYTPGKKFINTVLKKIKESAEKNGFPLVEYKNEKHIESCDLAIAAGGDGTFLWTASIVHPYSIPILGINLGSLGFLTDIRKEEIEEAFRDLKIGNYSEQERMMLNAFYRDEEDFALNDVVFSGRDARMIKFSISINEQYVTDLSGDGLIISTPTGSTAYSLSSGGPILTPGTRGFVITPISPHTLSFRPLVVQEESEISIQTKDNCHLIFDGQRILKLIPGEMIHVKKSDHPLKIVKIKGKNYFQVLREKLNWGNR
ncbi:MAG: NAD(+)/NADH kinase [candidate division WOR-3 bacterium]|nr:NAD(+)/NADH kinase [candidate division WOR-3 bacterium]